MRLVPIFFLVLLHLSVSAKSCNYRFLSEEADTFKTRISSHLNIDEKEIRYALTFLNNPSKVDQKYTKPSAFQTLIQETTRNIHNPEFSRFVESCRSLYSVSDEKDKVAIHVLLDEVYKRYQAEQNLINSRREFFNNLPPEPDYDYKAALASFLNVDREEVRSQ